MQNLIDQITYHDRKYWVENNPEITDEAYDLLVQELRELAPDHPLLRKVYPVQSSGSVKLKTPMLSLAKAYTSEEVYKWAEGVARTPDELFHVAPKFDGVACSLEDDKLLTRGDGEFGEDISDKADVIDFSRRSLPEERGELVVFKRDLPKLRRPGSAGYKTTRAAAVGMLNADKTDRTVGRTIRFMPYSTTIGEATLIEMRNLDWAATMADEQAAEYPVDGLVVSLADREYGESLGATSHHPRHSIAFKLKNPTGQTQLLDVEWQVGKGRITPVAILKPVEISGCTHDRASLHNLAQIARLGVGIGDTVEVSRCGDVIPQITQVLVSNGVAIVPPTACPACGKTLIGLTCTNARCGGVLAKKLVDSLNRMGVESIGPGIVSELVHLGIDTVPSVFAMSEPDWLRIPGFAQRSAAKMFAMLQGFLRNQPVEDYKVLAAMNIPGIGITLAKVICDRFELNRLLGADLESIPGLGETRVCEIQRGYDSGLALWAFSNLMYTPTQGTLSGPTICFTGADARPRDEWIKVAKAKGYTFAKAVTKKLTLLVCADTNSKSSKMQKARQYGINITTYKEFAND